jgi:hypothetical protein
MNLLILSLLLTPALSISGLIGLPYFPNEKIAFVLLVALAISSKYYLIKDVVIGSLIIAVVFLVIPALRFASGGPVNLTDVNMCYLFIAFIFYISYFYKNIDDLMEKLPQILLVQVIVSFIQQIAMQLDLVALAQVFNNYPNQINYVFGDSSTIIFRTSGLFHESSQYSMFLLFCIVAFNEKLIKKTSFSSFVIALAAIDLILNQSITAYIALLIYGLFLIRRNFKIINLIPLVFAAGLIFYIQYDKLLYTFSFAGGPNYPRFTHAYSAIVFGLQNTFFLGRGLSWESPTWDVVSIYFSGFGFWGLLAVLSYLYFIMKSSLKPFTILLVVFLCTNGNLLSALNIFLISIIFVLKNKNNSVNTVPMRLPWFSVFTEYKRDVA